ncbi:DUF3564 domain-containing protein [Paraburkholderia sp. BCC1885]|uniref:DUF3564 domain-containing protein n=1 Tax=Paraburkholderia sp. BCC1885 TaxID=2562669 RepID=UPI001181EF92|nr:DUF3564 domain-containing protein [Paraburkholderia sp. BCC1885]
MRVTLHLDTFDRVDPCAYAILWLDKETRQWSREGHLGLDLPEWGTLVSDPHGTMICGAQSTRPLCVLENLDLDSTGGPFEGETGRAQWCAHAGLPSAQGHWHVQCIDDASIQPEHGLFAADDNAL